MNVVVAGGSGFLGGALARSLRATGNTVVVLSRRRNTDIEQVWWDGSSEGPWTETLRHADVIVNACGYGLEHWPWTPGRKRRFIQSRVQPGEVLVRAISNVDPKPRVFVQFSGINRYGLEGRDAADESTPAAGDFLARLTVAWEEASRPLEDLGVRHLIVRNAVVLDAAEGLFPLMCLPVRLGFGGRLGNGSQPIPWIHAADQVNALLFLLQNPEARGAFNFVAPEPCTNAELMAAACETLRRPYWFHLPAHLVRLGLGEMGNLILNGRNSVPRRLLDLGFEFRFPNIGAAVQDLLAPR